MILEICEMHLSHNIEIVHMYLQFFVTKECSGSICIKFGLLECLCEQEDHLCDLCCKDETNGVCKPTKDIPSMKGKNLKQVPGAPCNSYNGYCDVFLKCRNVDRRISPSDGTTSTPDGTRYPSDGTISPSNQANDMYTTMLTLFALVAITVN